MRYRIWEITEFLNSHDTCWEMLKISLKHKKVFTKKYVAFTCFSINAIGTKTEQNFIYNFFPILAVYISIYMIRNQQLICSEADNVFSEH